MVMVAEAELEAFEGGGIKLVTVQLMKMFFEQFKKWVVELTKESLENLFSTEEGRDEFVEAFGRYSKPFNTALFHRRAPLITHTDEKPVGFWSVWIFNGARR